MLERVSARRVGTAIAATGCLLLLVAVPLAVYLGVVPRHMSSGFAVHAGLDDATLISRPVQLSRIPDIVIESGAVANLDEASTEKSANATARTLVLNGPLITISAALETSSTAPLQAELSPGLLEELSNLSFRKLIVRNGTVAIAGSAGKRSTFFDVTAEIVSSKDSYTVKGKGAYAGRTVSYEASWPRLPEGKRHAPFPVKMAITSSALDATFDGKVSAADGLRLMGSANITLRKLRDLARWFGISARDVFDAKEVHVKGAVDWSAGTLAFSRAAVSIDGNEGSGTLALATAASVPAIDATLAFESLDLSRYVEAAPSLASLWPFGFGAPDDDGIFPRLTSFDADLRMSATKLMLPYVQTGRAAITVSLKKGRLLADVAELDLEGGNFGGQMNVDFTAPVPRYSIRGKLENVDAGRSLAELLHRNPLQGRVNVLLELTGSGNTAEELVSALSGKVALTLNEGGRLGLDLRALRYAVQRGPAKGWSAAGKGQTALETLEARLGIRGGIITAEQLEAKGGGLSINGSGSINLPDSLLDIALVFASASGDKPSPAGDAVVMYGHWNDPVIAARRPAEAPAEPTR